MGEIDKALARLRDSAQRFASAARTIDELNDRIAEVAPGVETWPVTVILDQNEVAIGYCCVGGRWCLAAKAKPSQFTPLVDVRPVPLAEVLDRRIHVLAVAQLGQVLDAMAVQFDSILERLPGSPPAEAHPGPGDAIRARVEQRIAEIAQASYFRSKTGTCWPIDRRVQEYVAWIFDSIRAAMKDPSPAAAADTDGVTDG